MDLGGCEEDMAGAGRIRSDLEGSGKLWKDLVGSSSLLWVWASGRSARCGSTCLHSSILDCASRSLTKTGSKNSDFA